MIQEEIKRSRKDENAWPRIHYLWPLNPVMEWVNDKVTAAFGRHEVPVIARPGALAGEVIFVLSGLIPNRKSHLLVHRWLGASFRNGAFLGIEDFDAVLDRTGYARQSFPNRGDHLDLEFLAGLLPEAVAKAREWMSGQRKTFDGAINEKINQHNRALERLKGKQFIQLEMCFAQSQQPERIVTGRKEEERRRINQLFVDYLTWIEETMTTEDHPYLQLVAVLQGEVLRIGDEVCRFRCNRCGHGASGANQDLLIWEGMTCLRFGCTGVYRSEEAGIDYYAKLYETADIQRIFADQHTGLLKREDREELERRFKAQAQQRQPWDPNLLSCTPTLEMGIDIGDLSTVLLCSVPPAQANFLQRIGRAGRRDGNALNLTVANARAHDLYFYSNPKEMISGRVEPPGVFLNASSVLERQFTGFCFDRWVESGIWETAIPARLGLILNSLEPATREKCPHNCLYFIETFRTELLDRFIELFHDSLSDDSKKHLTRFVREDQGNRKSLSYRIVEGLHELRKERDSLQKKVRLLRERIRRKEEDPVRGKDFEEKLDEMLKTSSTARGTISIM